MQDLPPNTPVIIGVGVRSQKLKDPTKAKNAVELMSQALSMAEQDTGAWNVVKAADYIMVPQGLWDYTDPARILAAKFEAKGAKTILSKIGVSQQTLLGLAAERIQNKDAEVIIISGGEARYRHLMSQIQNIELNDSIDPAGSEGRLITLLGNSAKGTASGSEPDETLEPEEDMWLSAETSAGLAMPVGFYAIMEIARRYKTGMDVEDHRDYLGKLYSRFSEIACENPQAWKPIKFEPEQIRNASDKNKMLAFPYTKLHNTSWNVDQASAIIYCSVMKATELGIARDKWIFPRSNVESNYMNSLSERRDLGRSIGAELAAARCLSLANLDIGDIDFLDLYSCFPIAVQTYADALGVADGKDYTFTGGMPFAGGPLIIMCSKAPVV